MATLNFLVIVRTLSKDERKGLGFRRALSI